MDKNESAINNDTYEKINNLFIKFKILDGSMLKLIALITMLIDHIGRFILSELPFANQPLFVFAGHSFSWYAVFRLIGRTAFPIYCFLITEGFMYTHNRKKYGRNLLLFALISELPWNYAFTGTLFHHRQNVFFTLFLGYIALCIMEYFKNKPVIMYVSLMALYLVSMFGNANYDLRGVLLICIFYMLKNTVAIRDCLAVSVLNEGIKMFAAMMLINMYNGKRGFVKGKALKYAFYAFYPLHLLILGIIRWNFL